MTNANDFFYVITGGPGVGKTTLLETLSRMGYITMSEVARSIIQSEMRCGGDALPWGNKKMYTERMINASVDDYRLACQSYARQIVFFDRGLLDAFCYAGMVGMVLTKEQKELAVLCRYCQSVFFLPPWKEIYTTDKERKQEWSEAVYTYHVMKKTYMQYGYKIVEVPCVDPNARAQFVIETCLKNR